MKNSILLISGFLTIISISGQNYIPIVQENNEWNVLSVGYNWNFTDTVFYTETYKFEGDTTIDNINYLKVYLSTEEIPINWVFRGCIREDQDKKVFLREYEMDFLKYDFGVELGDTVIVYSNMTPISTQVLSIDSVYLFGSYRKKISLGYIPDFNFHETWIEGIGSNRGILQSGTSNWMGGWYWLSCMTDNGELVYINPNINSCYLISTGIEEINSNELEIYPNPTSNRLTLKFPDPKIIKSISISDLEGSIIKELEYSTEIDLIGIPSGIYFLKLNLDNGELIKKIVIK